MIWRAAQFEFRFPRPAVVMGILNVTPDSFSDGGTFLDVPRAIDHGLRLAESGADIIDVGGESTRPGASPVDAVEESRRVLPVIRGLVSRVRIPISVDTSKFEVAEAALQCGASIVNDVRAAQADPRIWTLLAQARAGYVAMHMQGNPGDMQKAPAYRDVVSEVDEFFGALLQRMGACGLVSEQVILDPGIGFGKNRDHNLCLLAHLRRFSHWGRPLMVGISRKSLIGEITGASEARLRLPGSLAGAIWSVLEGAQLVRVHDVAETRQALDMVSAILDAQSQELADSKAVTDNNGLAPHQRRGEARG